MLRSARSPASSAEVHHGDDDRSDRASGRDREQQQQADRSADASAHVGRGVLTARQQQRPADHDDQAQGAQGSEPLPSSHRLTFPWTGATGKQFRSYRR